MHGTYCSNGGIRFFEVIVKNQTDETYNEARHYGAGFVFGNADDWSSEITNTNFLRFFNGQILPRGQQVFMKGTTHTF